MKENNMYNQSALSQYEKINTHTGIVDADPHRLIQMLLDGALDRIAQAKGALAAGDVGTMGESLSKAIGIISGLQSCLDKEQGGEIADNLDNLYDYSNRRLLDVHQEHSLDPLDEVSSLLATIKSGWDAVRPEVPRQ